MQLKTRGLPVSLTMPTGPAARVSDNLKDFAQVMRDTYGEKVAIQQKHKQGSQASIKLTYEDSLNMMEMTSLSENLIIVASNFAPPTDTGVKSIGEDWARFHFRTGGASYTHYNHTTVGSEESQSASLFFHPEGELACDWLISSGEPLNFVAIWCKRSLLSELTGNDALGLPFGIRQISQGHHPPFFHRATKLRPSMYRAVQEILYAAPQTEFSTLFLRSKAYGLLYELLSQLKSDAEPVKSRLTEKDEKRLFSAYEILISEYTSPPPLANLARRVGVNRTKLAAGFREMFGTSIGELCNELRMDQAWHLLTRTDEPVSSIAYQLGYTHQANFATAVKRRFGHTPRTIRQGL